jgi:hypothetical protein
MAKRTKDRAGRSKRKDKEPARRASGKADDASPPGEVSTTAGRPVGLQVVPCALCRRAVRYEPGPGNAARALTDHYNEQHQGDARLNDLANGTGKVVRRAASPAYL